MNFKGKIWFHAYEDSSLPLCTIVIGNNNSFIPDNDIPYLFEPFFTTKTFGKGTGLGLSISKGLIDVHEGEIHYQRIADQSVFVVKLPTFD